MSNIEKLTQKASSTKIDHGRRKNEASSITDANIMQDADKTSPNTL
jgi:hypothetical protein